MTTTPTPTSGAADLPEALRRSTAADGKTELFNLPGYPLMVRAVDFNRIHTESEMRRTALLDEMQKAALAAGQATAAQPGVVYAELPAPNYPKSGGFPGTFAEAQMRAFADATHMLRASRGQAPAQPDPAYSAACHLATALFKKHFAHLPDFASGQAVWSLCDSTAGVISQIDNMVAGLVQPPTTSPQADSVLEDAARYRFLRDGEWRENDKLESIIRLQLNSLWDAAIDAARKQEPDGSLPCGH